MARPFPKERRTAQAAGGTLGRRLHARNGGPDQEEIIARNLHAEPSAGLDRLARLPKPRWNWRQSILIRELFADEQKKNPVTDAEIQAEYDKFVAANSGKEYKASHILVEKEEEAKAILAALKKGGKFEDIAKSSPRTHGSGAQGGDLDWANPSSYVPEFTEAMVKLERQGPQAPVKSQFGWHHPPGRRARSKLPKLEEVKPQMSQQLQQQKMGKFQEDLRTKAKVE